MIILAYCAESAAESVKAASDTRVIKTILGVMASKDEDQDLNVVAELFFAASRTIASDISPEVTTVDAHEILAKILVQTSRRRRVQQKPPKSFNLHETLDSQLMQASFL